MRQVRLLMRAGALLGALLALALAAWFGINATDEELSSEAKSAMSVPPPPQPSEKNGFIDFLALGAAEAAPTYEDALRRLRVLNTPQAERNLDQPFSSVFPDVKIDERMPKCQPAELSCLDIAAGYLELPELIDSHRAFLARYRAMREKPEFVDLVVESASPDDELPSYRNLFQGQGLSFLAAAVRFNAGDRVGAIAELEKENAFHRRMAAGSRTLLAKMVSYAALERDALLVADVARKMSPKKETALWRRLEALVRAPTKDELDVVAPLRQEFARSMRWMQARRYVRLSDAYYALAKTLPEEFGIGARPWWDPIAPYLYRPRHSLNLFAAEANIWLQVAEHPGKEYFKATETARERVRMLTPGALAGVILNPVGRSHPHLRADRLDYICRMHAHGGVLTLARLQVKLRAAGISKPEAVLTALASPLGRSHADPFTGEPMRFDPKTGTMGFEAQPKCISGASRPLVSRYGRMALPL